MKYIFLVIFIFVLHGCYCSCHQDALVEKKEAVIEPTLAESRKMAYLHDCVSYGFDIKQCENIWDEKN